MPETNMGKEALAKKKLYSLLAKLETSPGDYITLYMRSSSFPHYIDELSPKSNYSIHVTEIRKSVNNKTVIREAERYSTGAAIFWQENGIKHIVLLPFSLIENKVSLGELDTSLLYETLERKYAVRVALTAWGSYSIGIFQGDNLTESKTGKG